jgi:hypothetical protein
MKCESSAPSIAANCMPSAPVKFRGAWAASHMPVYGLESAISSVDTTVLWRDKMPRGSADRNRIGTKVGAVLSSGHRLLANRGRPAPTRSALLLSAYSFTNGAIFLTTVTGLAHFVMHRNSTVRRSSPK